MGWGGGKHREGSMPGWPVCTCLAGHLWGESTILPWVSAPHLLPGASSVGVGEIEGWWWPQAVRRPSQRQGRVPKCRGCVA